MTDDFNKGFFAAVDMLDSWVLQQKNFKISKEDIQKQINEIASFYVDLYKKRSDLQKKYRRIYETVQEASPL